MFATGLEALVGGWGNACRTAEQPKISADGLRTTPPDPL